MRRAFDPPQRARKPARSFDDSLAQSRLHSEQGRERRAAGDLGHFLLKLDDTISDFLAHVDSDARELPRGTRILEDRSGRSQLTKIVPELIDFPLHGAAHILRSHFQFAAGDREYTVISISRASTLATMLEFVEFGVINFRVIPVSGFARLADFMNLFMFAHSGVVLLVIEIVYQNIDLRSSRF
jgi:hypothetical protein